MIAKQMVKKEIKNKYKKESQITSENFLNKKKSKNINGINLNFKSLDRNFFMTNAVSLCKKLLGKILVRKLGDQYLRCRIVEVEAYMGIKDKGSHAYNNRKTERTKYYWLPGGHLNVYLIYGTNYCLNIVANRDDVPQGCLIRAVEPLDGFDLIYQNRKLTNKKKYVHNFNNLTNGPGKVCSALKIDKAYNGHDMCDSDEIFLVEDLSYKFKIKSSPRVNIDYAEEYKDKFWRFFIHNNIFVSKHIFNK